MSEPEIEQENGSAAPAVETPVAETPQAPGNKATRKKLADVVREPATEQAAPAEKVEEPAAAKQESKEEAPTAAVGEFEAAVTVAVLRASVGSDPRWDLLASKRIPSVVDAMRAASNGDLSMDSIRNRYAIAAMEGMVSIPRTPVDVLAKRAYLAADAVIREQG